MSSRSPATNDETIPMLLPRERPLLLVMDGHALIHRSFRAISVGQNLTVSKTGEDVTGVYGFSNTFLRAIQEWEPTHCAITFDLRAPTFRHLQYREYKAHRPETPPELRPQFDRARELMRAFNVPIFELEGYEADDVIGTICRKAEEQQMETVILTGDTDTFQLVSPWVRVDLHHGVRDRKIYDEKAVRERYGGLGPEQQPDLKAMKGDPSDNIPGVPGIGEKTAVKLLSEYHSLEGVYEHIDEVKPDKARESLRSNREAAFQGKMLTTIVRDAPVELDMDRCRFWNYSRRDVADLFRELEFSSGILSRVPDPVAAPAQPDPSPDLPEEFPQPAQCTRELIETDYHQVDSREKLDNMLKELSSAGSFSFDTETTSTDPMLADLVGLSFSTTPGRAWYVPVGHRDSAQIPIEEVLAGLKPLFESPQIGKTAHNGNYDVTVISNYGITPVNMDFDTMVAAHLIGRKALGLKNLALDTLNIEMTNISELIGTGKSQITMDRVSIENARDYACSDADMTGRLRTILEDDLHREGFWDLYSRMEIPLVPVLVTMQRHGIALDAGALHGMSRDLNEQLKQLEAQIYDLIGHVLNINSPQQLSNLLFNELGLPKTKRTKTGYSTDANSLESLKGMHPVVDKILDYRQLVKLKSTYVDALPQMINPRTGRLHTSYNQTGSATGRISSSDPNLQNIPIRTELGRQVRKAFVAEGSPDWVLLSADYSQIELRVLAHLSRDSALVDAFLKGEDIHSATGSLMYDVPFNEVNADMRRIAKVLNFGVIYGLSPYGISQQTEFSPDEGQKFIETYFSKYPGIRQYIDSIKEQVRRDGYVVTPLGRRRYISEINASNYNMRQAAERAAVNMPIQGGAADIMKLAMIRVHQSMEDAGLRARMLLQVHDELVFEVPSEEMDGLKELVHREMSHALDQYDGLNVPLVVDMKTGHTWGNME